MKRLLVLQSVNSLHNKALHIRLDGTVAIMSRRKVGLTQKVANALQSFITFISAPIP